MREYIGASDFARLTDYPSSKTYVVLDAEDETKVNKIVFKTNNIDGALKTYTIEDEFPTPTGTILITANAPGIDVKEYAYADVAVPTPTGTINITANATGIDVKQYATANVNVPNAPVVTAITNVQPLTDTWRQTETYGGKDTYFSIYFIGTNLTSDYIDANLVVTQNIGIGDATFSGPTKTVYNPYTNTKIGGGNICYKYEYTQTGVAEVTWTFKFGDVTRTMNVNHS